MNLAEWKAVPVDPTSDMECVAFAAYTTREIKPMLRAGIAAAPVDNAPVLINPADLAALQSENARLRAELERVKVDAERYRWLRAKHEEESPELHCGDSSKDWHVVAGYEAVGNLPDELDEAIDAARGKG